MAKFEMWSMATVQAAATKPDGQTPSKRPRGEESKSFKMVLLPLLIPPASLQLPASSLSMIYRGLSETSKDLFLKIIYQLINPKLEEG